MNRRKLKMVFEKTSGRCWYCSISMHPLEDWQVEHQHPRSKGGTDDVENLVPSCQECNSRKGPRTVEEYRHSLRVRLENKITEALEMVCEVEGWVGWDRGDPNLGAGPLDLVPPAWTTEIQQLLYEASKKAVEAQIRFHGENPIPITPLRPLSAIESEAVS